MKFRNDAEESRLVAINDEGKAVGALSYKMVDGDKWDIYSTFVGREHQGQGIAGKLLDEVMAMALEKNLEIIPTCSYIEYAFEKYPEKYDAVNALK